VVRPKQTVSHLFGQVSPLAACSGEVDAGFADKNMRQSRAYSHFRANLQPDAVQFDRKWL
jgi:hypothetical protein